MQQEILNRLNDMVERVLAGELLTEDEGRWLIRLDAGYLPQLMAGADRIRRHFRGEAVEACGISNVRSGNCSENCSFCSQSGHHKAATAPVYGYIAETDLVAQAQRLRSLGATDFGIVSKGWGVRGNKEKGKLQDYLANLREHSDIGRCASLGALDESMARELKAMGLENYHHNLECAESFFENVCTTHSYQENIDTIQAAQQAGMRVCAGGILGMGESLDQRVELAMTLRALNVESVPLNFLNPQPGTPMGHLPKMEPRECLHMIAVFRYLLPQAEIRIAGGRTHMRDLQAMIFYAGASGVMIGDYLTTAGRKVEDDLQMLRDLGVTIRGDTFQRRAQQAQEQATGLS
ncbi:biotin synthase BioB [Thermithiobacillus plumbiphilus]|uniref:Biotin synthase n=1 Tax=Thermithiobacillus plumbiphilus TaxID=1729899 RepID=A0ABU9D9K0_9PROT